MYFQDDFAWWAQQGQKLLDLHIRFETSGAVAAGAARKGRRNADAGHPACRQGQHGVITLDDQTTSLAGIPG